MARLSKLSALRHIRTTALTCLDMQRTSLALPGATVSLRLQEISDTNHKYVMDRGSDGLSGIVADLQLAPVQRLQRLLARVQQMEAAYAEFA